MGLGGYPDVTLARAREKARDARDLLDAGTDPIERRRAARSALLAQQASAKTFKQCARDYIDAKSPEWSNDKHAQQWTNTLETYAHPVLGGMLVRDIGLPHVLGSYLGVLPMEMRGLRVVLSPSVDAGKALVIRKRRRRCRPREG
jgi:hypothetical protein